VFNKSRYQIERMTSIRHCRHGIQWTGALCLRETGYGRRPLLSKIPEARYYSNSRPSAPAPKPLPFKPKPLVQVKPTTQPNPQQSPLNPTGISSSRPNAQQEPKGVYAPYLRISLGVVLIGSLIYSMVCAPNPPFLSPS